MEKLRLDEMKKQLKEAESNLRRLRNSEELKSTENKELVRRTGSIIYGLIGVVESSELEITTSVIEAFNKNVEGAEKALAFNKKIRSDEYKKMRSERTGKEAPHYKELDMEFIKQHYKDGYSPAEIGEKLGVTANTIRERLKAEGLYKDGRGRPKGKSVEF